MTTEWNAALVGAMDVAKVALTAGEELSAEEIGEQLSRLLAIVERTMPADLQVQDVRVARARKALEGLMQ